VRVAGAVDIGGTRTKIGIVAEDGAVVERAAISTPARGEPKALITAIGTALRPLLDARNADRAGVSVAGFLDREHQSMYANANLPLLVGFPLRRELERQLERECVLEVDSNAAVVAEFRHGAGKGAERLLGVTVGTGLGGGVIIDGQLLRHTGECAGDLGHIILDPKGRRCTCGSLGCLEALVCSASLSERAGGVTIRDVIQAAQSGNARATAAVVETATWLGIGLASLAPLFHPDTIIVGGGVAAAGELLLEPARASFREHAGDDFRDRVRIVGSELGGWEGMIGAASLALDPLSLDKH
jgi:glucokinase